MEITESMHPILQEIEGAYATAHRRLHNYKEWDEEHWGIIDDAFMSANNRIAALEAQAARYRAALIRYGAHTDINCTWGTDGSYVCACGLYGIVDQQEFEEALATGGPGGGVVGES